jgi:hypothetical protein
VLAAVRVNVKRAMAKVRHGRRRPAAFRRPDEPPWRRSPPAAAHELIATAATIAVPSASPCAPVAPRPHLPLRPHPGCRRHLLARSMSPEASPHYREAGKMDGPQPGQHG